jgi:hypothetical protein
MHQALTEQANALTSLLKRSPFGGNAAPKRIGWSSVEGTVLYIGALFNFNLPQLYPHTVPVIVSVVLHR